MKYIKFYIFSLVSALVLLCSCEDELLYENGNLGEGEVFVSASVEFEPAAASLDSRATAGNALKNIESLSIVIYNSDTTFNTIYNTADLIGLSVNDVNKDLPNDYPGVSAESTTARATFTLPKTHVGKYYIYAVANMGDLTREQVETPYKLKHLLLSWHSDNIPANSQMFGYFTSGTNGNSEGFDAPLVSVGVSSKQIHAWVKRAASKVTLVYDPSGLHNEVFVYIHKVTIRDIPKTCFLGAENHPTDTLELHKTGESIYYNQAGEQLAADHAPKVAQYENWMRVARGSGRKGAIKDGVEHYETSPALYFYENLQDNYANHPNKDWFDKKQKEDSVGTNINRPGMPDYKDNVPCGTYIEVEGYYVSNHLPLISSGEIKYRFMLGQDERFDYNALRNRHYKLTLGFKGYANQPDWHIDYVEDEPEIYVPAKYYVSYMYNQKSMMPVRVTGNCVKLEAEIIQNDWHPYDSTQHQTLVPPAGELGTGGESFQWNYEVWENKKDGVDHWRNSSGGYKYGRHKVVYNESGKFKPDETNTQKGLGDTVMYITPPHLGFLSLTVPTAYQSVSEMPSTLLNDSPHFYRNPWGDAKTNSVGALKNYYYANGDETGGGAVAGGYQASANTTITDANKRGKDELNDLPQNIRVFDISSSGQKGVGRNAYYVSQTKEEGSVDGRTITSLQVPLWTRPKSMIKISGFSGNNPYETYQRKSIVRFRATFKIGDSYKTRVKDVPIYQVRRIVNPKAVWRRYNNYEDPFDVKLYYRATAGAAKFTALRSEGSWKAYVSTVNDGGKFITLSGGVSTLNDTIFGDTDSEINFKINFSSKVAQTQSRCAIVTILYHGYSCSHTIYVRQGYNQALEIGPNTGKWSSFSLFAASHPYKQTTGTATGVLTKNPLALGTFFKRGNLSEGILISNNSTYPNLSVVGNNASFNLADVSNETKSSTWGKIWGANVYDSAGKLLDSKEANMKYSWPQIKAKGYDGKDRIYTVPTYAQYNALAKLEYGIGVMYADGATAPSDDIEVAFRYQDLKNEGLDNGKGMRGIVVYNPSNANQVFFPVGARGIGRRTLQNSDSNHYGTLRYGAVAKILSYGNGAYNEFRPICFNLPANPGSIYWIRALGPDNMMGWDMNYFDFSFNGYDTAAGFYDNGDALPIKLIYVRDAN